MKRGSCWLALSSLFMATIATITVQVQAQVTAVPAKMNFSGRLTKPDGTPVVDGTYSVRFSLHDAQVGGNEKWSQTLNSVQVKSGTFAALLDVNTANLFNGDLYLEIKIGNDAPLTPRQQLVSVPYALKANTVPDGSLTSEKFASGALNNLSWLLGGNAGTNPTSHFLGTTDNQPLVFKTGNAERLRVDSVGRVGIGTNSPAMTLDVAGEIQTNSILFLRRNDPNSFISYLPQGGTGAHEWWVGANRSGSGIASAGSFSFYDATAGANRLSLDGNGNVGIGTSDPQARLHVNGALRVNGNNMLEMGGGLTKEVSAGKIGYQTVTSDALDIFGAGTAANNRKIKFWNEGGATFSGGIFIGSPTITNTSAIQALSNSSVTTVFVSNTANGIGGSFQTADANALYAVNNSASATIVGVNNGSGPASSFTSSSNTAISAFNNSALPTISVRNNGSGEAGYYVANNNIAVHATNNSSWPTLLAVNSGIGNCASLLASNNTALEATNNSTSATVSVVNSGSGAAGSFRSSTGTALTVINGSINFPALFVDGGGTNYTAQFTGKLLAQRYDTYSDARFKTHIATFENALDTVLNLRGVTYDWDRSAWKDRNFPEDRQIGFIAQEVEKILPELVTTDAKGYKSVAYANVVPVLVEAVKTLKKENDATKRENTTVRAEINALKTENAEIKQRLEEMLRRLEAMEQNVSRK